MKEYKTISRIAGPLVFVRKTDPVAYGDMVKIMLPGWNGKKRPGTGHKRRRSSGTGI